MANTKSNTKSKKAPAKKGTTKPKKEPAKPKVEAKPVKEPTKKIAEDKPKKNGWIIGLIIAAVVVIIGVIVAVLCLKPTDQSDPRAKLSYSDSFFIYDDGNYTLWNSKGERVTPDEYKNQSAFVAGYAMVKKDDQYGVIRENGQTSIDFGKYGNIAAKGGLYLAQDGNTKEYSLLTGSGKELAKGTDLEVYAPSVAGGFAAVKTDGKIKVFSYNGTLIGQFDVNDEAGDPELSSSSDYGLVHYGNQNIVLDARNGSVVAEFEGPRYAFDSVSDSRNIIILENNDEDNDYKLVANGKLYDLNETKNYAMTALDDVVGYDSYSELALLDENYRVAKKVNTYLDLKDYKNYAVETSEGNVEIYRNGEKIKDFGDDSEIATSGIMYDDFYAIVTGDKAMFYNLDGEVGINHEFNDIYTLFDKFHHAVVADKEGEYFLINNKGEKIGDQVFKSISSRDGGYEMKDADGKYAIANQKGELVTDAIYDEVYYRSYAEPRNIWTGLSGDDNYDIIDADKGTVILENVDIDGFYANYFTVENKDGGTDYYTYSGTLFYTVDK